MTKATQTFIVGYGCTSAAGPSTKYFWDALCRGEDCSVPVETAGWPVKAAFEPRACMWPSNARLLATQMLAALREAFEMIGAREREAIGAGERLGVLFASTKGSVEDLVWYNDGARTTAAAPSRSRTLADPYMPLLDTVLAAAGLRPRKTLCVSNACASSLSALFLARLWLAQGEVSRVLVLAADGVGPFVLQGFQALRALTADRARPFAGDRSGLRLGEAAAAIVLTNARPDAGGFELEPVGLDAEGYAATRPSLSGESLLRACLMIPSLREDAPQLIIGHGTATPLNDQTEDRVFARLFEGAKTRPWITGTKWCIGHTLGASGAMDVIAACEALRARKVFHLANTPAADPAFRGQYLTALKDSNVSAATVPLRRVLVTSLGFGGVHAAAVVRGLS